MSTKVGEIGVDLVVNDKGFKQQMNGMQNTVGKFAKMLAGAFAVKKLVDFGAQAIKLGSDLAEVQNVVDVAFPKMSKQVDEFSKQAMYSAGLSETMSKRYVGTFGAMAKAFGFNEKAAYDMSTALTSLAGDVASFYNINQDEAYTKLKSVFTGETESLKELGVVMTQTALDSYAMANGFGKTTQQMSEAEKVALRFAFVTNQLSTASGDFARTSDSWANQVRIMKLQFESFMASVGQGLINIFSPVIKVINFLLSKLLTVGNAFKALTELLTGGKATQGSGIQETADAVSDLADNMSGAADGAGAMDDATRGAGKAADGAGKSAKKAAKEMKSLMGFDQINKLSEQNSDDGGGSGGSGGSGGGGGSKATPKGANVDMGKVAEGQASIFEGLFNRLSELLDLFKKGFDAAFRADGIERVQNALGRIGDTLQEIFTAPEVTQAFNDMLDKWAYALGQFTGSLGTAGLGIAVFLSESIANGLERQKGRIQQAMVTWMDSQGSMVASAGNMAQSVSDAFYEVITSTGAVRIGSAFSSAFMSAKATAIEIGAKFGRDIWKGLEKIVTNNAPKFANNFKKSLEAVAPAFEAVEKAINQVGDVMNDVYDNHISPLLDTWSTTISDMFSTFSDSYDQYVVPVLEGLGSGFSSLYDNILKPTIDNMGSAFGSVVDAINKLWTALQPVYNLLSGVLAPILGVVAGIIGGAFLAALGLVTVAINVLAVGIELVATILGTVFDVMGTVISGIAGFLSDIPGSFQSAFETAWNFIVDVFSGIGSWFGERWNDVTSILAGVGSWFMNKFREAWSGLTSIFSGLGNWFGQRWNDVISALSNVGTWFSNKFKDAWNGITNIFSGLGSWFGQRWSDVTGVLSNVASWFGNIFGQAFNAVKNAFSSIGSFFSGVWSTVKNIFVNAGQMVGNAVGGAFKSAVNAVLGTIENVVNGFVGMINGVLGVVRSLPGLGWVGSVSTVSLPRLAQGGFVRANTPQIAMIGDNKHYGEIVAPENKMLAMARKAAELTKDGGSNAEVAGLLRELIGAVNNLDLTMDGESVTKKIFGYANELQRRTNTPILDW